MKQMNKALLGGLLSLTLITQGFAGIGSQMSSFFNAAGMNNNVTGSTAYKDQSASFYSAGSLYARNQVANIQIVQLDMPTLSAGCGGIDAFLGGFSFIGKDQIVGFVKKIMSSAAGYMFDLALVTTVPELKNVKDFIQNTANKINSLNVNSCQAAQDLVGGLWPKTVASQRKICEDLGSQGGSVFSDWAAARQGCGSKAGAKTSDAAFSQATKQQKKDLLKNKNLIWDNLQTYSGLNDDVNLEEFLMSITGTIIFDKNDKVKFLPAQITNKGFINSLLYGTDGSIQGKVYHCNDDDKCLAPTTIDLKIAKGDSFYAKVQAMVDQLRQSIANDTPLTSSEKSFIAASPMPIMKYIMVEEEAGMSSMGIENSTVVDVLAKSILVKFFESSIDKVRASLAAVGYSPDIAQKLSQRIDFASHQVQSLKDDNAKMLQEISILNQHYQFIEKNISAGMSSSLQDNSHF